MTFQEYHLETRRTLPNLDYRYGINTIGYAAIWHVDPSRGPINNTEARRLKETSPLPSDLLETCHMIIGMFSEIGELSKACSKGDNINVREEVVDILWYASNYAYLRKIDISGYQFPKTGTAGIEDIACCISDLSDYTKKFFAYRTPIVDKRREDEVADYFKLLDTIGEFANLYGVNLYEGMQKNIDKLRVRFPDKFDFDKAQEANRDLAAERQKLE